MALHNQLGIKGEVLAEEHLCKKGFRIIERNWIHNKNEIDLIAENDEFIIFVEVKTRTSGNWGNPEEAVSGSKIRRIIEAADYYLDSHDVEKPARFDVIAIVVNENFTRIDHFEDAFLAPLN
ncbi:MAG TPA: YraN family protein [Dysgonomonas sp.]|nr:YraN family protein [Dysgonomonas sp.]